MDLREDDSPINKQVVRRHLKGVLGAAETGERQLSDRPARPLLCKQNRIIAEIATPDLAPMGQARRRGAKMGYLKNLEAIATLRSARRLNRPAASVGAPKR